MPWIVLVVSALLARSTGSEPCAMVVGLREIPRLAVNGPQGLGVLPARHDAEFAPLSGLEGQLPDVRPGAWRRRYFFQSSRTVLVADKTVLCVVEVPALTSTAVDLKELDSWDSAQLRLASVRAVLAADDKASVCWLLLGSPSGARWILRVDWIRRASVLETVDDLATGASVVVDPFSGSVYQLHNQHGRTVLEVRDFQGSTTTVSLAGRYGQMTLSPDRERLLLFSPTTRVAVYDLRRRKEVPTTVDEDRVTWLGWVSTEEFVYVATGGLRRHNPQTGVDVTVLSVFEREANWDASPVVSQSGRYLAWSYKAKGERTTVWLDLKACEFVSFRDAARGHWSNCAWLD